MSAAPSAAAEHRRSLLGKGLRLEYLTVGWNLVEGLVAVLAALVAGSVALLDSMKGPAVTWTLQHQIRQITRNNTTSTRTSKPVCGRSTRERVRFPSASACRDRGGNVELRGTPLSPSLRPGVSSRAAN